MALKLDFGCGNTPREGPLGVDITTVGTKADIAVDLFTFPWQAKCDFDFTQGDVPHPDFAEKSPAGKAFAVKHDWNGTVDIHAQLVARK